MSTDTNTYEVVIQPYSTGRLQGAFLDWSATAWRVADNEQVSRCFVTHWGAKRWARKENLDRVFAKYVDGGRLTV